MSFFFSLFFLLLKKAGRESRRDRDKACPEPCPNFVSCHDKKKKYFSFLLLFYQGLPGRPRSQSPSLPKPNTAGACKNLAIWILPRTDAAIHDVPASERRDLPFTEIPPTPYVTFTDYNRVRFKGPLILPNLVMSPTLLQEMNAAARVCAGLLARTGCSIVIDAVI